MGQQIRSADLLVKTALSEPDTMKSLMQNPEGTLKRLAKDTTQELPRILPPDPTTNSIIWVVIVAAFAIVMVGAAYLLGSGATTKLDAQAVYVTKGETLMTVFTTTVAFLAGLLSPSPIKR